MDTIHVTPSPSNQRFLNANEDYARTLETSRIKQMHKAIARSQAIKSDTSPSCKVIFADFVVLDFKPIRELN